MTTYKSPLANS